MSETLSISKTPYKVGEKVTTLCAISVKQQADCKHVKTFPIRSAVTIRKVDTMVSTPAKGGKQIVLASDYRYAVKGDIEFQMTSIGREVTVPHISMPPNPQSGAYEIGKRITLKEPIIDIRSGRTLLNKGETIQIKELSTMKGSVVGNYTRLSIIQYTVAVMVKSIVTREFESSVYTTHQNLALSDSQSD